MQEVDVDVVIVGAGSRRGGLATLLVRSEREIQIFGKAGER